MSISPTYANAWVVAMTLRSYNRSTVKHKERDIGGSIPGAKLGQALAFLALLVAVARADTISYTGTLSSPEDSTSGLITVTLAAPGTLGLQTYGFGGGTNAAGTAIPAGGFDPFVGVFAGSGSTAMFLNGTSDILSNYSSFMGCPQAGEVDIGGLICGDISMSLSLPAGTYSVLLIDGEYIPAAVFEASGQLGDGFVDFSGGAFQTCNGIDCVADTANWALDVTTPASVAAIPEPTVLPVSTIAFLALVAAYGRRRRQTSPFRQGEKR